MSRENRGVVSGGLRATGSVAAAALLVFSSLDARAGLLDEPPRIVSLRLDDPASPSLTLLQPFFDAEIERPGPLRRYLGSRYGHWGRDPWWHLAWSPSGAVDAASQGAGAFVPLEAERASELTMTPEAPPTWLERLDPEWSPSVLTTTGPSFASNGFDALWEPPPKPVPWWKACRRRPVTFVRYGAEQDTFPLVRCDGAVATFALDRLSLMARPPDVPRPSELLPDEPDAESWQRGEWIPSVHLVHPRLAWALQRIADAFPRRVVYIFSGYRPKHGAVRRGSHHSMHGEGRAMDIGVMGVPNAQLFQLCHALDDVGCGYYPNSKFVHVDVRLPGTGHAFWIDASAPGEPSRYVDRWPGVIDSGGLAWDQRHELEASAGPLAPAGGSSSAPGP